MTDATQNTDRLSLDECLAAMRRIGVAHEDYVVGYEHGYSASPFDFTRSIAYARGRSAGVDAHGRGAHGSDAPVYVPPWVPSRDGAM